jgi:very-short-patch-repair endonuclease
MNSFADHPRSKCLVDKSINTSKIKLNCRIKYLFQCDKCPHQFEASISNVAGLGRWCPYHCIPSQKLCDCDICFQKSFASHPKSKFLADKTIDATKIRQGSANKYEFKCDKCNHLFKSSINHIIKGVWCPYCSKPCKLLCDDENCLFCFNNSFASCEKSKYLVDKSINPRKIFLASETNLLFQCNKCPHQFYKRVFNITSKNTPIWCPYCVNQTLCDCEICYNKSFASHPKSKYLVDKTINTSKITLGTNKKYLFQCEDCNGQFKAAIYHITSKNEPQWCPLCKNKSEKILQEFLLSQYSNVIYQFNQSWCKNILNLRYDFCIPELKIIIELDGRQHFMKIKNWGDPKERVKTDIYKMKCAINNGYSVIRLLQEDVYYNRQNWKQILIDNIKYYQEPIIIFIDKNNIYINHIDNEIKDKIIVLE